MAQERWRQEILEFYGDNADEELFCIPRAASSTFMSAALIEARMTPGAPTVRWEPAHDFVTRPEEVRRAEAEAWCEENLGSILSALDKNVPVCFGEDFARSGDLTVVWPLQLGTDLVRRTPFVVELRNVPFRQQEQILFYIVDRLPRFFAGAMDARGNGQFLAESAAGRYGDRIAHVMLTEGWYRNNMPRYKAAFEDGTIEIPKDGGILMDNRAIVVERGIARVGDRKTGADGGKRHGDSAIAAALAYFASRAESRGEVEYAGVPRARWGETRSDPFGAPPVDSITRPGRFGLGSW